MYRILTVFGTRPEAIKLSPVVSALAEQPDRFESIVGITGQHDELVRQVLHVFGIRPHFNLAVMKPDQDLTELTASILVGMGKVLSEIRPDMLLVQGDTTTVFASAVAAFNRKIPIGHVEAGLRTRDKHQPFPEEINRRLTDHMSDLFFAPTERNRLQLLAEGLPDHRIHVTGNTVVDALLKLLPLDHVPAIQGLPPPGEPMVLVTAHRREHFGRPMREVFRAIRRLAESHPGIHFVYPVHPNPQVKGAAFSILSGFRNIHLIEPVDYLNFIHLMKRSLFILTDSGGIQEEAPTLGKPVLILRNKTERPELVEAGGATLVGTDRRAIVAEATRLIEDRAHYERMASVPNPFGDGNASRRIVAILKDYSGEETSWNPMKSIAL